MVALPDTVHRDTIECSIDEKGRLEVRAQNKALEHDEQKRNIPIGFRQDQNAVSGIRIYELVTGIRIYRYKNLPVYEFELYEYVESR
ncbi:hypothetical protein Ddc_16814 [Ditylenchus destructor]|nr:hypothetical protein Ddc_16814 [Ditylenchus destructor]